MHRIKDERVCSFCGETSEGCFAGGKGVLCVRCHYFGNVQMGKIPAHSIYCFKCNTYARFRAEYDSGTVDFAYCVDDSEGAPLYIPINVEGTWNRHLAPNKLLCGSCGQSIPTELMYVNTWTTPIAQ